MPVPTFSGYRRLTKTHKLSAAGIAAAGAAALAFAVVPGSAQAEQSVPQAAQALSAKPVAEVQAAGVGKIEKDTLTEKSVQAAKQDKIDAEVKAKAEQAAKLKKAAEDMAKKKADFAAKVKAEAKAKADKERTVQAAANRSTEREAAPAAAPTPEQTYPNNLDGWIREAMSIMKKHGIPGSYEGIHRNIIRESGGNPRAINNWDINAQNGVPSKGLLQVIQPTFDAYHVEGTANDLYDPVANIVAACNYAADRYGSMDNVNSAY
ncbi:transglycosylase SLT domain-containing protein [Streptomyces pathocidini]|uniref:Transglycosylase SLT domain-containing protein n=1 Tax=Streptomyces pathocidini TaxID=1650571 RepID=A0ABW7UX41_9ACTN